MPGTPVVNTFASVTDGTNTAVADEMREQLRVTGTGAATVSVSTPAGVPTLTVNVPVAVPAVPPNSYFVGTGGYATLEAAVTALGSTAATVTFTTDQTLTGSLSLPATLEIVPKNGAKIVNGGYTVAFTNPNTSAWPDLQIFSGTGAVSGLPLSKCVWFGAGAGATANANKVAINRAFAAVVENGTVLLPLGTVLVETNPDTGVSGDDDPIFWVGESSPYTAAKSFRVKGHGMGATVIKLPDGSDNYDYIFNHGGTDAGLVVYSDFTIDENIQGNPGVDAATSKMFDGYPRIALAINALSGTAGLTVERVEFKNTNGVNQLVTSVPGSILRDCVFRVGYDDYAHDVSSIYTNAPDCVITGNQFYGQNVVDGGGAVTVKMSRTAIETHGKGHLVTGNKVYEYSKGANITGLAAVDSEATHVTGNTFWNVHVGVMLYSGTYNDHTTGYGLSHAIVANNIIRVIDYGFSDTFSLGGVMSYVTMSLPMKNVQILNNDISYDLTIEEGAGMSQRYYRSGICLYEGSPTQVHENIVIAGNTVEGAPTAGVLLKGMYKNLTVRDNVAKDCWNQSVETGFISGIHVRIKDASNVTIRDNTVIDTRTTTKLRKGIVLEADSATDPFSDGAIIGNTVRWAGLPPVYEYYVGGDNVKPYLYASIFNLNGSSLGSGLAIGSSLFDRMSGITYRNYDGTTALYGEGVGSFDAYPVKYQWPTGSRAVNIAAGVGEAKAWRATTGGAAYSATRANTTAYNLGDWIRWSASTTVWECTTAGTSDAAPPSITGLVDGNTVTDGTVVWTRRNANAAAFTSEGNL